MAGFRCETGGAADVAAESGLSKTEDLRAERER